MATTYTRLNLSDNLLLDNYYNFLLHWCPAVVLLLQVCLNDLPIWAHWLFSTATSVGFYLHYICVSVHQTLVQNTQLMTHLFWSEYATSFVVWSTTVRTPPGWRDPMARFTDPASRCGSDLSDYEILGKAQMSSSQGLIAALVNLWSCGCEREKKICMHVQANLCTNVTWAIQVMDAHAFNNSYAWAALWIKYYSIRDFKVKHMCFETVLYLRVDYNIHFQVPKVTHKWTPTSVNHMIHVCDNGTNFPP